MNKSNSLQNPKTVSIVWWGIGWLASAILLAKQWYKISLYEKNECLGGRASILHKDGYTFDMGPSRYLMPDIFEEFFESIDEDIHEYLDLKQLSPSYRVFYGRDMGLSCPKTNENIIMSKVWTSLLLKKNVIILHWLHDDANTWRRKRLWDQCVSQWVSCFQPQCDHEHGLSLEKDLDFIVQQVWIENFHEWTIIVWYSLWWVTAKHLINKIWKKINKLITIASSFPRPPEWDDKGEEELLQYRNTVLNFELFNSLTNVHITIFSKDDPVIPYEKAINYRSEYYPSSTVLSYEWKWHFGKRRNVDSIPELLPFIVTNQIQITTYNWKICCNNIGLFGYNKTEEKIRNGVLAIIKNTQTGKFLLQVKKKAYNIITLCGGWVEEWENCEDTIIREIKEETGLLYPKIITKLGDSTYLRYRKWNTNLFGANDFYYIEVESDTADSVSSEEQDKNWNIWLDEQEVAQSISFYSHLIGWFRYKEWIWWSKDQDRADKEFIQHCLGNNICNQTILDIFHKYIPNNNLSTYQRLYKNHINPDSCSLSKYENEKWVKLMYIWDRHSAKYPDNDYTFIKESFHDFIQIKDWKPKIVLIEWGVDWDIPDNEKDFVHWKQLSTASYLKFLAMWANIPFDSPELWNKKEKEELLRAWYTMKEISIYNLIRFLRTTVWIQWKAINNELLLSYFPNKESVERNIQYFIDETWL